MCFFIGEIVIFCCSFIRMVGIGWRRCRRMDLGLCVLAYLFFRFLLIRSVYCYTLLLPDADLDFVTCVCFMVLVFY